MGKIIPGRFKAVDIQIMIHGQGEPGPLPGMRTHIKDDGAARQKMPHNAEFAVGHHVAVAVAVMLFDVALAEVVEMSVIRQYSKQKVFHAESSRLGY